MQGRRGENSCDLCTQPLSPLLSCPHLGGGREGEASALPTARGGHRNEGFRGLPWHSVSCNGKGGLLVTSSQQPLRRAGQAPTAFPHKTSRVRERRGVGKIQGWFHQRTPPGAHLALRPRPLSGTSFLGRLCRTPDRLAAPSSRTLPA